MFAVVAFEGTDRTDISEQIQKVLQSYKFRKEKKK